MGNEKEFAENYTLANFTKESGDKTFGTQGTRLILLPKEQLLNIYVQK
jgi:hypothetical protein